MNKHIGSSFEDFRKEVDAMLLVAKWMEENAYATKPRHKAEDWENLDGLLLFLVAQIAEIK